MDGHCEIPLRPSRLAQLCLAVMLLLVWLALWCCGLPVWLRLALASMVAAAAWRQHRQLQQTPVLAIIWRGGRWWLRLPGAFDGVRVDVSLAGDSEVYPRWQSLHFVELANLISDGAPRRWNLLLWPDSSDAESLRRLRVILFNTATNAPDNLLMGG